MGGHGTTPESMPFNGWRQRFDQRFAFFHNLVVRPSPLLASLPACQLASLPAARPPIRPIRLAQPIHPIRPIRRTPDPTIDAEGINTVGHAHALDL
jgi:hypothetical protein